VRLEPIIAGHRNELYRTLKGGTWVEIGVQEGLNALAILQNADPEKLHLVDPWEQMSLEECPWLVETQGQHNAFYGKTKRLLEAPIKNGLVEIHRRRSLDAAWRFSKMGLTFDRIYIDANHTYEHTRQDFLAWLPLLKPDGTIMCHDYVRDGHNFGVIEAVDDVVEELQLNWQGITGEPYPTAVIRKKAA